MRSPTPCKADFPGFGRADFRDFDFQMAASSAFFASVADDSAEAVTEFIKARRYWLSFVASL